MLMSGSHCFRTALLALTVSSLVSPKASGQESVKLASPAAANARMDSVEKAALTAHSLRQHIDAVLAIRGFGEVWMYLAWEAGTKPTQRKVYYPGVVARLARIYWALDDYQIRDLIIRELGYQAEHGEAVAFLARVAQESVPATESWRKPTRPDNAISFLSGMGPEGSAELERLHRERAVQEPMARARLDSLARTGFRRPRQ